ncbi:GNAT family N-acetyltransferase [Streptomyces platensis]|uniref:GNAT family N-acetyltransferase n=1 Tax=Streptomyces platensis TaxID=58346 RepID=UPI00399D7248
MIDLDRAMIGMVELDRHDAESPGHVRPDVGEAELSYLLLPEAWGRGYGSEAVRWRAADSPPGSRAVAGCCGSLRTSTPADRSWRSEVRAPGP